MNKKEFLIEARKRFKYIREPIKTDEYTGGLRVYSMWIVKIENQTAEEIGISFWVKHCGLRTENVIAVQPSIEYVGGVPVVVKQLKEILNTDKSNLNKK